MKMKKMETKVEHGKKIKKAKTGEVQKEEEINKNTKKIKRRKEFAIFAFTQRTS